MGWELITSITIASGTNTVYQGGRSVQYSMFEFPSDVTVVHRYRGYIVQIELVVYSASLGSRMTVTNREELWSSRQFVLLDGNPASRFLQFVAENRSSDVGRVLNYYSFD